MSFPLLGEGVVLGVLGLSALVLGTVLDWRSLEVIGAAFVVLPMVAVGFVLRRSEVEIQRTVEPSRVEKGSAAIVYMEFQNRGRRRTPPSLARQVYGDSVLDLEIPRLFPGQRGVRVYRLPTSRRGIFTLEPLEVRREDPFGLARTSQSQGGVDEIWVIPKVYYFRQLSAGVTRHIEGASSELAQQGTITFHRLREYVVGDDLRMIHWRSTAKAGQLMVRHNVDTSETFTVVLLDVCSKSYLSDLLFEEAVDVAASVAIASSAGMAPTLIRTSLGTRCSGGRRDDLQLLTDFLTNLSLDPSADLAREVTRVQQDSRGTTAIVVTGSVDLDDVIVFATLRQSFHRVVVISLVGSVPSVDEHLGVSFVVAATAPEVAEMWNSSVAR
ncbi:MAG: DUF58 domain-containing protein [Ferrimicrobium sp.]